MGLEENINFANLFNIKYNSVEFQALLTHDCFMKI